MSNLHAVPEFQPTADDLELERRLAAIWTKFRAATNRSEKMRLWEQYAQLHACRSAQMVTFLERKRNIHREAR